MDCHFAPAAGELAACEGGDVRMAELVQEHVSVCGDEILVDVIPVADDRRWFQGQFLGHEP